jgi:hypothetical protein
VCLENPLGMVGGHIGGVKNFFALSRQGLQPARGQSSDTDGTAGDYPWGSGTYGRGVSIGLAMDGANRNDFKMVRETIESLDVERSDPTPDTPQGLCWTQAMALMRSGNSWASLVLLRTSVPQRT